MAVKKTANEMSTACGPSDSCRAPSGTSRQEPVETLCSGPAGPTASMPRRFNPPTPHRGVRAVCARPNDLERGSIPWHFLLLDSTPFLCPCWGPVPFAFCFSCHHPAVSILFMSILTVLSPCDIHAALFMCMFSFHSLLKFANCGLTPPRNTRFLTTLQSLVQRSGVATSLPVGFD